MKKNGRQAFVTIFFFFCNFFLYVFYSERCPREANARIIYKTKLHACSASKRGRYFCSVRCNYHNTFFFFLFRQLNNNLYAVLTIYHIEVYG